MLNPQDYFDKHLLRLGRELRGLWRRRYYRVALEEPLQRGWRRTHALTAKAESRPDAAELRALLLVIGTAQFRNSADFRDRRGRGRRRRFFEIEQPLRVLPQGEWERQQLPERWKRYFYQEERCAYRAWRSVWVFTNPHLYELQVEPYWITELEVCDPVVAQRIAEIESWLWHRDAWHRLDRLCGHGNHWHNSNRPKLLANLAQREVREAMQNPWEVDSAAPVRRRRFSRSWVMVLAMPAAA